MEIIFINNYTLNECTHHCITYSVTAHPDDGQAQSKHVGATNSDKYIIFTFYWFSLLIIYRNFFFQRQELTLEFVQTF